MFAEGTSINSKPLTTMNSSNFITRIFRFALLFSFLSFNVAQAIDKKVIYYHDRANDTNNKHISLLPLIQNTSDISVTNILIATLDLNSTGLFLRSDPKELHIDSPAFERLWEDVTEVQKHGIKVSGMMLGAFGTLSGNDTWFETNYAFLHDGIKKHKLDGLDIDVETTDAITLDEVIRLIDRLRKDFGPGFLITMSPVAEALSGGRNLSGFNYKTLEARRGDSIAWYNAQFYNSFGLASSTDDYDAIIDYGFKPNKVVMGMTTDPANADDFVPLDKTKETLQKLVAKYPGFKGVAGWVYFDARPGRQEAPWKWSQFMAEAIGLSGQAKNVGDRQRGFRFEA
jgi:hypothetical protein